MASDILIDNDSESEDNGDIFFDGVNIVISEDDDTIRQRLYLRLSIVMGEWNFDLSFGVPYYENILGKNFNPSIMNAIFIGAILGTPGVKKLKAPIVYDYDPRLRTLGLSFAAITDTGSVVEIQFSS